MQKMEILPIAAIKLISDISIAMEEALNNNLEAFEFIDEDTQRDYTEQEKESIAKYNTAKIASDLLDIDKRKDRINYFNKTVKKNDRRSVLTDIIINHEYNENSLGIIKPKEIFLFTPKCKCCGNKLASEYFFETPVNYYPYSNDRRCPSCSHDEGKTICEYVCCSKKWDSVADKLACFKPFFDMGFSIVNIINQVGYELSNVEDSQLLIELVKSEKIYPSAIFSARNINSDEIATVYCGNIL